MFLFPSPPVLVPILWELYQAHQLQLVSPSLSCSRGFSVLLQGLDTYLSFRFLSVLPSGQPGRQSPLFDIFSFLSFFFFCCWLSRGLVVWPRLGDLFVSKKSQWRLCVSFSIIIIIIIIIIIPGKMEVNPTLSKRTKIKKKKNRY